MVEILWNKNLLTRTIMEKRNLLLDRWKNRRAMAWIALLAGLAFPVLLLFTQSDQLGSVAGAFYVFVTAVVGAYMGFTTLDDKWQQNANFSAAVAAAPVSTAAPRSYSTVSDMDSFPPEPK